MKAAHYYLIFWLFLQCFLKKKKMKCHLKKSLSITYHLFFSFHPPINASLISTLCTSLYDDESCALWNPSAALWTVRIVTSVWCEHQIKLVFSDYRAFLLWRVQSTTHKSSAKCEASGEPPPALRSLLRFSISGRF